MIEQRSNDVAFKRLIPAIFMVALATLVTEIALSRTFSVITYYYLAFLAISIAMLGGTAGAITVYLKPKLFQPSKLKKTLQVIATVSGFAFLACSLAICFIPLKYSTPSQNIVSLVALLFFCSLPFYISGIFITAALTKTSFSINKLYAADLIGAAAGCLVVIAALEFFTAPALIFYLSITGPAVAFWINPKIKKNIILNSIILCVIFLKSFGLLHLSLHPTYVKGRFEEKDKYIVEKWNSHSRVTVEKKQITPPQLWGASPKTPEGLLSEQYNMTIDGDAGTVMRKFTTLQDIEHLKYDLTSIAYTLREKGSTCIIGVGGAKDIQAAVLAGSDSITGIDVNPVFIDLLSNRFKDFAGVGNKKNIALINDEARTYLNRTQTKFSIIQMALIDTWAATGAGAFSLTENNLYTINAWNVFLSRLDTNGILTVSRWYNPDNLGETGRLTALAVAALLKNGIADASKHIALVTVNNLATILVCKSPFSQDDIALLKTRADSLQFNSIILPGYETGDETLKSIVSSKTKKELNNFIKSHRLRLDPPTDDNPYFFNMLRLKDALSSANSEKGVMGGNLQATRMLLLLIGILALFAVLTILTPLLFSKRRGNISKKFSSFALYFSLIGAGFILIEIAFIQKLNVYLGRPVYALGIVLFTIILSAGIGSYISEKIITNKKIILLPIPTCLLLLSYSYIISSITTNYSSAVLPLKILICILLLFPVGILLGCFLPLGLKMAGRQSQDQTAWLWGLNGIFSVLFSAVAVFLSIYAGISFNIYIAAAFYLLLTPIMKSLTRI